MTQRAVLELSGMHCTSCARLIELTLKDESGIDSVAVDYESGEAVVEFDPERVDPCSIGRAIEALGYGVVGERPLEPGAKRPGPATGSTGPLP